VPLQNRVNPFGELCAFPARSLFMGNRGGRLHTDAKTLTARRSTSRAADATSGAVSTPSCSFLTSQPRLPPATGPASNAGVRTRSSLPKNGAKRTGIASRHTPRRWTTCCTQNAYEDVSNACRGATSTSCQTAHLLHSMERPSPFVATHSYTGRRMVTMLASRGRAASLSTCSPRQR
jgi:hypothetical protein